MNTNAYLIYYRAENDQALVDFGNVLGNQCAHFNTFFWSIPKKAEGTSQPFYNNIYQAALGKVKGFTKANPFYLWEAVVPGIDKPDEYGEEQAMEIPQ